MKIYMDISLENFEAWSGAVDTLNTLREKDLCDRLESMLNELYPDGMTDTELNDLLLFDDDIIAEWLGFSSWEDLENDGDEEEEEDNGLPNEANENYDEITEEIIQHDAFKTFCKHNEFNLPDCEHCVLGCLNCNADCEEVFNRFKELEG